MVYITQKSDSRFSSQTTVEYKTAPMNIGALLLLHNIIFSNLFFQPFNFISKLSDNLSGKHNLNDWYKFFNVYDGDLPVINIYNKVFI